MLAAQAVRRNKEQQKEREAANSREVKLRKHREDGERGSGAGGPVSQVSWSRRRDNGHHDADPAAVASATKNGGISPKISWYTGSDLTLGLLRFCFCENCVTQ